MKTHSSGITHSMILIVPCDVQIAMQRQQNVAYTRLGTKYVHFVREEILIRGDQYNPKDGIRKIGKQLLTIELIIQQEQIKES